MERGKQLSEQKDDASKLKIALRMAEDARSGGKRWRELAEESYGFVAGHGQWTEEEKYQLTQDERPCLTWNYTFPVIETFMGMISQNRILVKPHAVEPGDQFLADVLDSLIYRVMEIGHAEEKVDDATEDLASVGRGFVPVDFFQDPDRPTEIKIKYDIGSFRDTHLDPSLTVSDVNESDYVVREKWLSRNDFKRFYPKYADDIDHILDHGRVSAEPIGLATILSDIKAGETEEDSRDYDEEVLDYDYYSRSDNRVRVFHMEYYDLYTRYYATTMAQEIYELDKDQVDALKENPAFEFYEVQDKKVKWLQFTKNRILYDGDSPVDPQGFSIPTAFGYRDKTKSIIQHFGLVEQLKDPQREINKRWSQALNQLVNQGQGIAAEIDAVMDVDQAKDTWNDPKAITWLKKGGINKLYEKKGLDFPVGAMQMEEMAQEALKKIGINPDLQGLSGDRQEAGIVLNIRRQQGWTRLGKLYKAYKQLLKDVWELTAKICMKNMPDSQIQRILGETDDYIVQNGVVMDKKHGYQANLRDLRDFEYNIITDEAPGNITKQMAELQIFMEMMQYQFPVDPRTVIEKLDLPLKQKNSWLEYIDRMEQQQMEQFQSQVQAQQQKDQAEFQLKGGELQRKMQKDKTDAKLKMGRMMLDDKHHGQDLQQAEREDRRDYAIDLGELDKEERGLVMNLVAQLAAKQQPAQLPAPGGT